MDLLILLLSLGVSFFMFSKIKQDIKKQEALRGGQKNSSPVFAEKPSAESSVSLDRELGFSGAIPSVQKLGILKAYGIPRNLVSDVLVVPWNMHGHIDKAINFLKKLYLEGNANGLEAMEVAAKGAAVPADSGIWFCKVSYKDGSSEYRCFISKL